MQIPLLEFAFNPAWAPTGTAPVTDVDQFANPANYEYRLSIDAETWFFAVQTPLPLWEEGFEQKPTNLAYSFFSFEDEQPTEKPPVVVTTIFMDWDAGEFWQLSLRDTAQFLEEELFVRPFTTTIPFDDIEHHSRRNDYQLSADAETWFFAVQTPFPGWDEVEHQKFWGVFQLPAGFEDEWSVKQFVAPPPAPNMDWDASDFSQRYGTDYQLSLDTNDSADFGIQLPYPTFDDAELQQFFRRFVEFYSFEEEQPAQKPFVAPAPNMDWVDELWQHTNQDYRLSVEEDSQLMGTLPAIPAAFDGETDGSKDTSLVFLALYASEEDSSVFYAAYIQTGNNSTNTVQKIYGLQIMQHHLAHI